MKRLRDEPPARGTRQCKLSPCLQWAQYESQGQLLCGLHSMYDWERERLPEPSWERAVVLRNDWQKGGRVCYRCVSKKFRPPDPPPNTHHVFLQPNMAKGSPGHHYHRLSTWFLGPVQHRAPTLPPADRLETYWRYAQVWPGDLNEQDLPSESFFERRNEAYGFGGLVPAKLDRQRHALEQAQVNRFNTSECAYWVHPDTRGQECFYTHIESRYFFCCAFEALVSQREEFWRLRQWRLEGATIVIWGTQTRPDEEQPLWRWFESTQCEFGAELALLAMLTMLEPAQYPWHQYRRRHEERFKDAASVLTEYHACEGALYG